MAIEPKIYRDGPITIIDPNPPNQVVEHEDLYIYASLVAKTKGRSFLTEGTNGDTSQENINISTVDMVVSDTATSNGKKREFLTTAWSDIGGSQMDDAGSRGDVEGFGITNIDIEIKGSYVPKVVIDFVDIRGATLFEQGSCSPYGMFFHLPYPIFELTLKGYYGKPATYFLNLQKFNTKFNTETGNFECKAEFIGWSYAFLADMLMGFVRCSNYMTSRWGAKASLRKKYDEAVTYYMDNGIFDESDYFSTVERVSIQGGHHAGKVQPFCRKVGGDDVECKSISNMLDDISAIKIFLQQAKGDADYIEIANLITVRNSVASMKAEITKFTSKLERDFKEQIKDTLLTQAANPDGTKRNIKELYVFNQAPDDALSTLFHDVWNRPIIKGNINEDKDGTGFGEITANIPTIKETPTKELGQQKECGGTHIAVASNKQINGGLTGCKQIAEEGTRERYQMLDFLDDPNMMFQDGMIRYYLNYPNVPNTNAEVGDYYIDVGFLTTLLDGDINTLDEKIEKKRNSVKEAIDEGVIRILGFRPTIRNIFTILSCNVENFVALLLKVSIEAEEHHNEENKQIELNNDNNGGSTDQLSVLKKQANGEAPKTIYPWPTYYKTNYRSTANYSANNREETKEQYPGVNDKFKDWPEVRFIEDFLDACNRLNENDEDLLEDKEGRPGWYNYMPINPLESKYYSKVQLKYREKIKSLQDSTALDNGIAEVIAERMFVTLDFSYFDPIRYNQFNLGLGFNYPGRIADTEEGNLQEIPQFQKQRLWGNTLYNVNNEETNNPVITLARIDAHNLMSCITDADTLSNLNLRLFSGGEGFLSKKIEQALKGAVEDRDKPTDGTNSWFTTDAEYTDLSENISPANILEDNVSYINNYEKEDGYWAYYPQGGYIRLLGKATIGGFGDENSTTAMKIYSDIRKMQPKYLFKLVEGGDFENTINENRVDLNYSPPGDITDRRLNLQTELGDAIKASSKHENPSTQKEMEAGYTIHDETKLVMFDGSINDSLRLFTTLGIGAESVDNEYRSFDLKYSGIPLYPTSDDPTNTSRIAPGWGSIKQSLYPFMQSTYMFLGNEGNTTKRGLEDYANWTNSGGGGQSVFPMSLTMEPPGTGMLSGVGMKNSNDGGGDSFPAFENNTKDPTKMGDLSTGFSTASEYNWGWVQEINNLIQIPLWLDNVNRFRNATTVDGFEPLLSTSDQTLHDARTSNADWGYKRPLTTSTSELNHSPTDAGLTTKQIESRNLAYLFLAGCKTTPFITCGQAEATKKTFYLTSDSAGDGAYNYRGDHYPKALRPFVTSQGLIKIPKIWVYGMGSVMWRWKMYMGTNTDGNGNIRWRHPAFGEEPTGMDPLAQPGHPGVACESREEVPINGFKLGNNEWTGRKNRSRTQDGNVTPNNGGSVVSTSWSLNQGESFANTVFQTEKNLWGSNIDQHKHTQISCFSRGVTRVDAINRATYAGNGPTSLVFNGTMDPTIAGTEVAIEWRDTFTYGCMFDYYGVYNADKKLNMSRPQGWIPNANSIHAGVEWVYLPKPTLTCPFCWGTYYTSYSYPKTRGPWTAMWDNFADDRGTGDGGNLYNTPNATLTQLGWQNGQKTSDDGNPPLELQMRSAKEAASNSFWPVLWCAPWQHFYTEAIAISGTKGLQHAEDDSSNKFVEQTMSLPMYDTIFKDYVGNFGYLGESNNNYAGVDITKVKFPLIVDLPTAFIFPDERPLPLTDVETYTVQLVIKAKPPNMGKSALLCYEGGKYAEVMALLPTIIKEKFVTEFETWCDNDWRGKYLGVVDPVNFKLDGNNRTGDRNEDVQTGLLGESYRYDQFFNSDILEDLMGITAVKQFTDPEEGGSEDFFGVTTLSTDAQNGDDFQELQNTLVKEFYYAIIPTPRIFNLDVWNGDKSELNGEGVSKNAFYANKKLAELYLNSFQKEWKDHFQDKREELTVGPENRDDGSVLNDDDIKLSLYRSFKSIVDKWISSSTKVKAGTPSYFFNITDTNVVDDSMGSDHVPLAGHFSYVNRVMQEIGNKAVLDVMRLKKIPKNPKMSFYNVISDLLGENNFDFFPLPTYTNFANDKSDANLKSMFRSDTNSITKGSGPNFICMYVGGTSRTVSLKSKGSNCPTDNEDMSYNDDGFSMSNDAENSFPKPNEWQDPLEPLIGQTKKEFEDEVGYQGAKGRIEGNGVTAFRVAYGIENQNMFKSVELDQSEFSETNESLLVIDRLANGGNPGDKTNKGQNLHNLYLTRSYSCTVQSMGNMMIQPLQYFELTNIPMFYGTYLITEVKHNVKPHHIGTTFKGVRQPLATVPIVEDIATAMSLSMKTLDPLYGVDVLQTNNGTTIEINLPTSATSITDSGVEIYDIGETDKSNYYNHKFKLCDNCTVKVDGKWEESHNDDGSLKDRWWVAYNQPTSNITPSNVEYVALHWSGGYQKVEDSRTLQRRGLHYHYEINKDGGLWKLSDTKKIAYHGRPINSYSIGISYAGGVEDNKEGHVYVRTANDWNTEDLNLNGRDTFKAKKQWKAIIEAIVLAVEEYPNIKYVTSHHWFSSSKSDVGSEFPWDTLLAELATRNIHLKLKYSGTAPGGVDWVAGRDPSNVNSSNIDLAFVDNALEQEVTRGQQPTEPNSVGPGTETQINDPGNTPQEALGGAGQIT